MRIMDREQADVAHLEAAGRLRVDGDVSELLVSIVTPDQLRTTLAEL